MAPEYDIHQQASGSGQVTQIGVVENYYEAPKSSSGTTASVTLELDLNTFDAAKLISFIAGLTQVGISDIHVRNVASGSIIVTLDMPPQAAATLVHLARTRPDLFAEFRLRSIQADIPLTKGAPPPRPPESRPGRGARRPAQPGRPGLLGRLFRALGRLIRSLLLVAIIGGLVILVVVVVIPALQNRIEPSPPGPSGGDGGVIACGRTRGGTLARNHTEDFWEFNGDAGQEVIVGLGWDDEAFEPFLMFVAQFGVQEEIFPEDEFMEGLYFERRYILPQTGRYGITVGTNGAGGGYELGVACPEGGAEPVNPPAGPREYPEPSREAVCGTEEDGGIHDEQPFEAWSFEGQRHQRVTITMTRVDGLDPYLLLLAEDGAILAEDDDGGGDLNARIVFDLPYSGPYRIVATRFGQEDGGSEGGYLLAVSCIGPID